MADPRFGSGPEDFVWASGIEDTFIPQTRPGHRALDEYELMDHYAHWRDDLSLGRELGVRAMRWGVPWYRVEPRRGEFDWTWTDQVLAYLVEELSITPIVDLMHYGCPLWLGREFASPEYPQAVSSYARAFAERYAQLVRWYTPLNEPLVNAEWCGLRGRWPPYLRGERGHIRLMLQLADGILATVAAIQSVQPDAIMVHVEATGLARAASPDLASVASADQSRRFLMYDLITGRVTPEHTLFPWLVVNGASANVLRSFVRRAVSLDVLGINFYPQWSTEAIDIDARGHLVRRPVERDGAGFPELLRKYYDRYRAPIMVTETSAEGTDKLRSDWLRESLAAIKHARAEGVPVVGYTWFPLFTMIEWHYRFSMRPKEDYLVQLGLYRLAAGSNPRWRPTPLVEQFKRAIQQSESSIGTLAAQDDNR
ncbi:MAG: family 1 glycosylhydrolase [Chloroflexota bacterium]|nr:family 1 glycosylhydrolase [Chloroflexota bacterium]